MSNIQEQFDLTAQIEKFEAELAEAKAKNESMSQDPTAEQRTWANDLIVKIDKLKTERHALVGEPTRPGTNANGGFNKMSTIIETRDFSGGKLPPLAPGQDKSYRNMFYGEAAKVLPNSGFDSDAEFYDALISGRFDPRLKRSIQTEGTQSLGGFDVSPQ